MNNKKTDPLYDQAVCFVQTKKFVSTSTVQREIRIGYNRAASMMERMQKENVLAPGDIGQSVRVIQNNEQP